MKVFSKRLNALLKESGVTKYRLAKEIGVNKQTVAFWCDEISEPSISNLKLIAEYFDVTSDYLIGLENDDGSKPF